MLVPLAGKLTGNRSEETLRRLAELDAEKEKVISRRQDAETFFIKGLLDAAVYTEEVDAFERKEKEIEAARQAIENDTGNGSEKQVALNELLHFTAKKERLTEFSETLFLAHVDHIIIYSRTECGFAMKCGPVFRERIGKWNTPLTDTTSSTESPS